MNSRKFDITEAYIQALQEETNKLNNGQPSNKEKLSVEIGTIKLIAVAEENFIEKNITITSLW